jgi:hypothetical protein
MAKAEPPKLMLPTENDGLLTGDFAGFYQYVQRDFEGQVSQASEGGQYGFVRNPRRIGSQIIYTRFHEGIDIRPYTGTLRASPKISSTRLPAVPLFTRILATEVRTTAGTWSSNITLTGSRIIAFTPI